LIEGVQDVLFVATELLVVHNTSPVRHCWRSRQHILAAHLRSTLHNSGAERSLADLPRHLALNAESVGRPISRRVPDALIGTRFKKGD
jgi:hypothetical protein